jgi:hypothetical protein
MRSCKKRSGGVSPKWQEQIGTYWDADAFELGEIKDKLKNFGAKPFRILNGSMKFTPYQQASR